MLGLFDGTKWERPVTCATCNQPLAQCKCPRNAAGQITRPQDQPARVRREKRAGRFVTVITGLDPKASDLPALLKELRSSLGTGGTIKDGALELQGDHRDALVDLLRSRGYPAKPAGG